MAARTQGSPLAEHVMLALSMDYQLTIPAILRRTGQLHGDRPASSRRPDGTVHRTTYSTLRRRADRLGTVLHTLNLRLHPDELAFIATDAGDRVLVVEVKVLRSHYTSA